MARRVQCYSGMSETNYAVWCDAAGSESGRQGKRLAFGPETFDAWLAGTTPAAYVATLPASALCTSMDRINAIELDLGAPRRRRALGIPTWRGPLPPRGSL